MPADVHDPLPELFEELRGLLEAPLNGDAPVVGKLETVLTTGYARALELEAEQLRLERRIGEVLARREPTEIDTHELSALAREASTAREALTRLRALLTPLRERVRLARTPGDAVPQLPSA